MKKCETCRFGRMYELDKPCIVYREDCPLYEKEGDGMTRDEAIMTLKVVDENATCDDCLYYSQMEDCPNDEDCIIRQALDMAIKALEQEPCEDEYIKVPKKALKYRTAGMVAYNVEWLKNHFDIERAVICGAQEPKTGHWIEHPEIETSTPEYLMFYECSECGGKQCFTKSDIHKKRFCSNCGCRMVEPQENDHKCHTCKHYTSGEQDGSCDSYICEHYSGWEARDKE